MSRDIALQARAGATVRATPQPAGCWNLAYQPDADEAPSLAGVLAHLPERPPVSIRLGHKFLSSHPKAIDDFSGSTLLSALRVLQKIKNLDGPDDIAGAIPTAFSKANQPYIEIGLLSVLFVLVLISAVGAVKAAKHGFAVEYPGAVKRMLDHQRMLIESLRHEGRTLGGLAVPASGEDELGLLVALHARGVERHALRQSQREKGALRLWLHNMHGRWRHVGGNGELCADFIEEVADIVAHRMARCRIVASVETCYQVELLERLERERHAGKRARTARLFTGIGMPTMAGGMVSGAGAAACDAAAAKLADKTAAEAAGQVLDKTTGGVMMFAQAFQGASGVLSAYASHQDYQQARRDMDAVRSLDSLLPEATHELYRQDSELRSADHQRREAFGFMLATGQTLMLGSNVATFLALPPVAMGLAIPGATFTIVASVCGSINDDRRDKFVGAEAVDEVKHKVLVGNLGQRLRDFGLDHVIDQAADAYAARQRQVVQTRLWNDILATLGEEELLGEAPERGGEERLARLVERNQARRKAVHLLDAGEKALAELRRARYHDEFLDQPQLQIQKAIAAEMWLHPCRPVVAEARGFQQEVMFATADTLARRRDPQSWPLFHWPGGRPRARIHADEAFFAHLKGSPLGSGVFLRCYNEALARHLTPGDRFARNEYHRALTDLAHTRLRRAALAARSGLDPDVMVSLV